MKKDTIIVSFTTWPKRDKFVPLMIETINSQSLKPDKVIMWLSEEEYPNKVIPQYLCDCVAKGYITDIMWTQSNIYAHKRWETQKLFPQAYNITVDDDILYEKDFIKDLYETSSKHPNCVTEWTTRLNIYEGNKRIDINLFDTEFLLRNQFLSGLACFPPNLFPQDSFNFANIRDEYGIKSDDAWIRAWLVKKRIGIIGVHNIENKKWRGIKGTEECGNWLINKQINENGVQGIVKNFANSLIVINAIDEALKLWPKFDIYGCSDINIEKI